MNNLKTVLFLSIFTAIFTAKAFAQAEAQNQDWTMVILIGGGVLLLLMIIGFVMKIRPSKTADPQSAPSGDYLRETYSQQRQTSPTSDRTNVSESHTETVADFVRSAVSGSSGSQGLNDSLKDLLKSVANGTQRVVTQNGTTTIVETKISGNAGNAELMEVFDALMHTVQSVKTGETNVVNMSFDSKTDPETRMKNMGFALKMAVSLDTPEMLLKLIDKGADINIRFEDGKTALIHATERRKTEIVKTLLDKGADVNQKDSAGRTALQTAQEAGNAEIVRLLQTAGAMK